MTKQQNKSQAEFFILNDRMQCKDCPAEIGRILNKFHNIPNLSYLESQSPLVNRQTEEYFKSEYTEKFDFNLKKMTHFPGNRDENRKFPVLLKVIDSDTTIMEYDRIFSGRKGKIDKKAMRKFIKSPKI